MQDLTLERMADVRAEALPSARGPLSARMLDLLTDRSVGRHPAGVPDDPLGDDDLHLALGLAYELSYRGLPGVRDDLEWDLGVLSARRDLEDAFEAGLRHTIGRESVDPRDVPDRLREVATPPDADSLSAFVEREATLDQAREFLMHRSAYQLKEADPHSWVIPRLVGAAKSAVMEIQYDEYGSGDAAWMHSELFRTTMIAAGLDGSYGVYLDRLPGPTLATVNLITLFGMHRRWRGALVGHLAAFEMTSSLPNRAYAQGFRRLGFDDDAVRFFDEHVEADSVHEVLAGDLAAGLAAAEPELASDVVFGAVAMALLEGRFADGLLRAWRAGDSALLAVAFRSS
ncbi:MAG TPA: iron-containing redox enzyme family protein [Actinomycetota bacterium]